MLISSHIIRAHMIDPIGLRPLINALKSPNVMMEADDAYQHEK